MRTALSTALLFVLATPASAQIINLQSREVVTSGGSSYSIQPGDVLRIDVWEREEYSGLFQVNDEGFIFYPVLGEIDTKGITVGAVRDTLLRGLEQLFTRPFVSVTPLFRVSVVGFVVRPGLYTVDPTLSILDVVSLAGGARSAANTNKIRVLRTGEAQEINFENEAIAGRSLREIGVRSGDDIIVPRKFFAREDWGILLQAMTVILSIAIFINTTN